MRTVSPLDLRRSLGSILDAASAGERFLIERDHRPLAMLVSIEDGRRLDESAEAILKRRLAALDRLDEMRERAGPRPAGVPDAAELMRQERSRDDPDGYPEYPEDRDG